jgi:hypothetical protein
LESRVFDRLRNRISRSEALLSSRLSDILLALLRQKRSPAEFGVFSFSCKQLIVGALFDHIAFF